VAQLPSGIVTFLFADLEGSTRLWQAHPDAMGGALARHDDILRAAVMRNRGSVVKTTGDGIYAVFVNPCDAVSSALDAQLALAAEQWGEVGPLRVRMGIHTGSAETRDGDYYGIAVNRAARLMSAAHGEQVLISNASKEFVRDELSSELQLLDLGEHWLRDLSSPERVFQLAGAGLRKEFGPLRAAGALATNLPLQVTSFIGRSEDLTAVSELLAKSRLVTLTGVGGVGKTRLALQVASEELPNFPAGVWMCELSAVDDAGALAQVVAATLGVAPRAGASLEGSICEFLQAKQLLIVLDNCEHVLDAAGRLADALLRRCPGVRILATSREGLGIAGEHVWTVSALSVPDSSSTATTIAGSDAALLFLERASAVRAAFTLDRATTTAVGNICRRLDGIPLAIELAAARVVAMTAADIATRLDERFRLLQGGGGTADERHQTLRATVDWSYELLSPTERIVFDRLGVFAGSFDAVAAEAVAGDGIDGWEVHDALTSLVKKSMVVAAEEVEATSRYQMLETLRYYALERLEDGDRWRNRHAQHYARFAVEAGRAVTGPDEVLWRARIHSELDNLRAAVNWGLSRDKKEAALAVGIVAALARESYLDRSAGIGEWAERARSRTSGVSAGLRSAVLAAAAQEALGRDDLEAARALALEAAGEGYPDDCPAPAFAHTTLASVSAYTGRPDVALRVIEDASAAVAAAGSDLYSRASLRARASILRTWNEDPRARDEAEEAVGLARRLGNPSALADALYALSWAALAEEPDAALRALDEGIALTRSGASDGAFDGSLAQAARLRASSGQADAALILLREALAHSYQVGYWRATRFALTCGVEVLTQLGFSEPAAVVCGWNPGPLSRIAPQRVLRTVLGPEAYERAAQRGADMTFDEVVEFAIAELDRLLANA